MYIPQHFPQVQYGHDDGLIGSAIGCLFVLVLSYFEFKFKKQK